MKVFDFALFVLVLLYVGLSAFLEFTIGSRITPADFVLAVIMLAVFYRAMKSSMVKFSVIHLAGLPLLISFAVGVLFADDIESASLEYIITVFGFLGAIAIYNVLRSFDDYWLARFLNYYTSIIGLLALVSIIDYFFLPGLISSRNLGGIQGPFRNTGQAGSFFAVHLSIIVCLYVASLIKRDVWNAIMIISLFAALVLTFKRASIISVFSGLIFYFLLLSLTNSKRDKSIGMLSLLVISVVSIVSFSLFNYSLESVEGASWRFNSKFSIEAFSDFQEGFLADNIDSAYRAFAESPVIGVGLGNVAGVYQHHEIHSTYLGVMAYGGVVGLLSYGFFMFVIIRTMLKSRGDRAINKWAMFLFVLTPLMFGLMIGWGYTYHIRKREFWLLVVFVSLAVSLVERDKLKRFF